MLLPGSQGCESYYGLERGVPLGYYLVSPETGQKLFL